ncbi:MAG TPA: hypothetical protein VF794_34635 [Archangium sp.]|jgi:hypothetical protein|uniref:hypothetical protein n=1 Tax=Archangium sp. TaxID=1872627 RepID=UPI002ED7C0EE
MARVEKRASMSWKLILAVAVLAGCNVSGEDPSDSRDEDSVDSHGGGPSPRDAGGQTRWVHTVRSEGSSDAPVAVGQDGQGHILTLGNHRTPIDFGEGPVGGPSGASVLVVSKYAPEGGLLWARLLEAPQRPGVSPYVRGQALAIDEEGSVLLLGMQSGGLELGGSVLPPGPFLARLDANGQPRWARALPTSATELAVSRKGDITLAGVLTGRVDFGDGPRTGNGHPFLVRYGSEGKPRWVYVDSERGVPMDLAQDDAGDLYLTGGRFPPTSPLLFPFLSRLSDRGVLQWTRQLEGAAGLMMSVAAHGDHVAVSGYFTGSFLFQGAPLSASTSRGFALTYGKDGAERWGLLLGSTWGMVEMDQGSGLVIAGRYAGGEDFGLGLGELTGYPGSTNLYVLRLQRPTGKAQWMRTYPSASSLPVDLSVPRQGASALVGTFRAPVDFGTGPRTPGTGANAFVLQLEK